MDNLIPNSLSMCRFFWTTHLFFLVNLIKVSCLNINNLLARADML